MMPKIPIPDAITDPKERVRFYKNAWSKEYAKLYPDREKLKKRTNYLKYQERNKALARQYQFEHPEAKSRNRHKYKSKELAYSKIYRKRNLARYALRKRENYAKDPSKVLSASHARRVRIRGGTTDKTNAEKFIWFVKSQTRIPCYYCGKVIPGRKTHIDHVVAISRGGNHASENLCASCPTCNLRKHDKLVSEWANPGQQLLSI